jgi:hypothetical protein
MTVDAEKESKWHSRAQSALLTAVAGVSVWALQTLTDVKAKVARIDNIEIAVSGSYSRREAEKDQAAANARMGVDENRIDGLEARVRRLEIRAVRP